MGDIWFSSTPFYSSFHSIALNGTFILFNNLHVLFSSERGATKILWPLSDGRWDRVTFQSQPTAVPWWFVSLAWWTLWDGSVLSHLTGRILTAWLASLLWSIRKWKDSVFSPVIMVVLLQLETRFSKRGDVLWGEWLWRGFLSFSFSDNSF